MKKEEVCASGKEDFPMPLHIAHDFEIPVPGGIPFRYVGLKFATYCMTIPGTLYISVTAGKLNRAYQLDLGTIKDNAVLTLDLEEHALSSSVQVSIAVNIKNPMDRLAIWYSGNLPFFYVEKDAGFSLEGKDLIKKPLISIITSTYRTDLGLLVKTAESVLNQTYDHWEWVITDDGSRDEYLVDVLEKISSKDSRVRVLGLTKNTGIARAQNKCLERVQGDWLVVLDHDDLLHEDALFEIALAINDNPSSVLVYTDEDKVNENGVFYNPFHKPGWSPSLLLCQNYINHLCAFNTNRIREKCPNGYEEEFDGSQDYRFLLKYLWSGCRMDEGLEVVHIPKILYHWRASQSSVAKDINNKTYALARARKAIESSLKDQGIGAKVFNSRQLSLYRPFLSVGESDWPPVNVVIPTKDHFEVIENCLESLAKTDYPEVNITIVDNGSTGKDEQSLKRYYKGLMGNFNKGRSYIGTYPFNFSYQSNLGFSAHPKNSGLTLFLNNDTEVIEPGWLKDMVSWLVHFKDVAVVGAKLLYPNGCVQHAGVDLGVGGVAGHTHRHLPPGNSGYFGRVDTVHEVSAVTGACMLVKNKVFKEVGMFEEELPRAFNDVDLCLKIREKGYRILYDPHACLYHHESLSRGGDKEGFEGFVVYMLNKWGSMIQRDPYFNINFSRRSEHYVL